MTQTDSNQDTKVATSRLAKQLQEDFMSLTKARLSLLVVITAVFGYLVAVKSSGAFSWGTFSHMVFGTILAAFGAAVFNQLMEVDVDAKMKRTSDRPLPSKRMPRPLAFILGWLFCAFGLIHLGVMVNVPAAAMAAATLFTYLFIYTPMKRISSFNTVIGGVSGALPPLIGWAAGEGSLLSMGAFFLFALLFLWQMPHFAAINWMYREEYSSGGFKMWSNDDETGRKTAKIALFFSVCMVLLGLLFPLLSAFMESWGLVPAFILSSIMAWLAFRFLRSGERKAARTLFFYTLFFLPLIMIASYFSWVGA